MKKLKYLMLGASALLLAMTSFSSCNTDSDDELSVEEQQQAYRTVAGTYSGKIYYNFRNDSTNTLVADSLDISWAINTDSTVTIYDFPTALLAQNVQDANLKAAMESYGTIDIKMLTYYWYLSPVCFYLFPQSPTMSLTYNSETHTVNPAFYAGYSTWSMGQQTSTNQVQMRICEAAIYIDDEQTEQLSQTNPFILVGSK